MSLKSTMASYGPSQHLLMPHSSWSGVLSFCCADFFFLPSILEASESPSQRNYLATQKPCGGTSYRKRKFYFKAPRRSFRIFSKPMFLCIYFESYHLYSELISFKSILLLVLEFRTIYSHTPLVLLQEGKGILLKVSIIDYINLCL